MSEEQCCLINRTSVPWITLKCIDLEAEEVLWTRSDVGNNDFSDNAVTQIEVINGKLWALSGTRVRVIGLSDGLVEYDSDEEVSGTLTGTFFCVEPTSENYVVSWMSGEGAFFQHVNKSTGVVTAGVNGLHLMQVVGDKFVYITGTYFGAFAATNVVIKDSTYTTVGSSTDLMLAMLAEDFENELSTQFRTWQLDGKNAVITPLDNQVLIQHAGLHEEFPTDPVPNGWHHITGSVDAINVTLDSDFVSYRKYTTVDAEQIYDYRDTFFQTLSVPTAVEEAPVPPPPHVPRDLPYVRPTDYVTIGPGYIPGGAQITFDEPVFIEHDNNGETRRYTHSTLRTIANGATIMDYGWTKPDFLKPAVHPDDVDVLIDSEGTISGLRMAFVPSYLSEVTGQSIDHTGEITFLPSGTFDEPDSFFPGVIDGYGGQVMLVNGEGTFAEERALYTYPAPFVTSLSFDIDYIGPEIFADAIRFERAARHKYIAAGDREFCQIYLPGNTIPGETDYLFGFAVSGSRSEEEMHVFTSVTIEETPLQELLYYPFSYEDGKALIKAVPESGEALYWIDDEMSTDAVPERFAFEAQFASEWGYEPSVNWSNPQYVVQSAGLLYWPCSITGRTGGYFACVAVIDVSAKELVTVYRFGTEGEVLDCEISGGKLLIAGYTRG